MAMFVDRVKNDPKFATEAFRLQKAIEKSDEVRAHKLLSGKMRRHGFLVSTDSAYAFVCKVFFCDMTSTPLLMLSTWTFHATLYARRSLRT